MTAGITLCSVLLGVLSSTLAIPATSDTSSLSQVRVHSFKPYTFYAATAYCPPETTINWSCGRNCRGNPDFVPVASGGDGSFIQYCECIDLGLISSWILLQSEQGSLDMTPGLMK